MMNPQNMEGKRPGNHDAPAPRCGMLFGRGSRLFLQSFRAWPLVLGLLLGGCAATGPGGPDITDPAQPDAVVCADLADFPQDLSVYAAELPGDGVLLSRTLQLREDRRFNSRFFAPWRVSRPSTTADQLFEAEKNLSPALGYGENLRPLDPVAWQELLDNANRKAYRGRQGTAKPGITVKSAHLRRLPTHKPYFLHPRKAGEGFPFDYLQNSTLWPGTPVSIIHTSRDGAWVYVETRLVAGWLPATDVAVPDKAFMEYWLAQPLAALLRDNVPLADTADLRDQVTGKPLPAVGYIGTVLPLLPGEGGASSSVLLFPARNEYGAALVKRARVPKDVAAAKPLPLTASVVAAVGNAMMGQPYGWGGLFENRDCSALLRDLFTPFGIWLPRNSQEQGKTGEILDARGLTPEEKEALFAERGKPFFSLVRMPGHVGLYLGVYPLRGKDVPVMFHSLWGLRVVSDTKTDASGKPVSERAVIGKAVVTSLRPGAEHPRISSPASLLDRITGLAILPETP